MFWKRLLHESVRSVWAQKGRSLLTSLGIIIGAATIMMVINFGEGAKQDIAKQFSNLSVTTIFVNAPASTDGQKSKLSYDDVAAVREQASHVSLVAPILSGKVPVTYKNTNEQINIVGTTQDFGTLSNLSFSSGGFITDEQDISKRKVVVIGATAAETLFGEPAADVIGESVIVNKKQFEIIGIIDEKGGSYGPLNIDESIFMPFKSAEKYALASGGKLNLDASATDLESISVAMDEIAQVLREEHKIAPGGAEDFKLKDMGSNVTAAKSSAQTMAVLLSAVAVIVLVVGGIGIMNVMYINVTERTKEIGLRKALGAKKKHIMLQFISEATIVSLFGSFIGLLLGAALYPVAVHLGAKIAYAWWGMLIALGFSLGVGIFFGFYPAKKAANLNPIEALRYE